MRAGTYRIGGGDGAVPGRLVVVHEDLFAPLLLPPGRGHPVGHPALQFTPGRDGGAAHLGEGPARCDRHEDVQAAPAGGLGPAAQVPVLVEHLAQFVGGAHGVLVVRTGLRVEVDAEFVRAVDVVAAHRPRVEGERAVLRGPEHGRHLGGAHLVGTAPAGEGDVGGRDPVGHVLGCPLLEEVLALDSVRVALQGGGAVAQGAQDAVTDGEVVLGEVQLREAALRKEDLVRTGQTYGPAGCLEFHRFAHAGHGRRTPPASHTGRTAPCHRRIEAWICR